MKALGNMVKVRRIALATMVAAFALLVLIALGIDDDGSHAFACGVMFGIWYGPIRELGLARTALIVLSILLLFLLVPASYPAYSPGARNVTVHIILASTLGWGVVELWSQLLERIHRRKYQS